MEHNRTKLSERESTICSSSEWEQYCGLSGYGHIRAGHPFGLALFFCLFLLLWSVVASADDALRERLQALVDQKAPIVLGVSLASTRLLDDFYRQRDYRYAWHDAQQVDDLLQLAEDSVSEGFRPSDFHAGEIIDSLAGLPPSDFPVPERVGVDLLLSDSLLRLIHHHRYGKVDPNSLDKKWNHMEGPYASDLVDDLEQAVAADDLQVWVEALAIKPAFYSRLKQGLARYREIAAAGGWPEVPAGKMLRPGMQDPRVPVVRERLRTTGDFQGPASDSARYDEDLQAAVLAFQSRHHLGTDSVVGPATLAAMNIMADERVDQIRVNLERMRWVSDGLPGDLVLVDIAGQEVQLFRDDEVVWKSRVIVGRPTRPTPVFRDQIEYLELNPNWTVPPTILKKDILPAMRKNPGYLKKKGLQVISRAGKPVSSESVNWQGSAASFPYMIRQPPGSRNALGEVKFMFPNRYSVYLHDTPSRSLFSKPKRLYSSGCVRVERPWELAELVLNDPEHWNKERFESIVASKRTRRVDLKEPLPVVLAYWTAEAGADGAVKFREDVYARDAAVLSALYDEHGPIRIVYRERAGVEPAAVARPRVQNNDASGATESKTKSNWLPQGGWLATDRRR